MADNHLVIQVEWRKYCQCDTSFVVISYDFRIGWNSIPLVRWKAEVFCVGF